MVLTRVIALTQILVLTLLFVWFTRPECRRKQNKFKLTQCRPKGPYQLEVGPRDWNRLLLKNTNHISSSRRSRSLSEAEEEVGERVEAPALAGPAQLSPLLCTLPRNRTISTNCIPDCTINTPALLSQSFFSALLPDNFYKFTQKPSLAFFAHCTEPVQVEPPQLAPIVTKIEPPPSLPQEISLKTVLNSSRSTFMRTSQFAIAQLYWIILLLNVISAAFCFNQNQNCQGSPNDFYPEMSRLSFPIQVGIDLRIASFCPFQCNEWVMS